MDNQVIKLAAAGDGNFLADSIAAAFERTPVLIEAVDWARRDESLQTLALDQVVSHLLNLAE